MGLYHTTTAHGPSSTQATLCLSLSPTGREPRPACNVDMPVLPPLEYPYALRCAGDPFTHCTHPSRTATGDHGLSGLPQYLQRRGGPEFRCVVAKSNFPPAWTTRPTVIAIIKGQVSRPPKAWPVWVTTPSLTTCAPNRGPWTACGLRGFFWSMYGGQSESLVRAPLPSVCSLWRLWPGK
mmetsp:Transcript_11159/g.20055  ORF Transcript_11159/g.20055 Transcript_11159/m.20055 type:complete len:180 (-) Transcript_11159:251-790(-)